MRRFQFRLERFLDLKRWKERECEIALARVLGECLLLERRIAEIGTLIGDSLVPAGVRGSAIDVIALAQREHYVQRLAVERQRARTTLEQKRKELQAARDKYLQASKERRVLDKLKERRSAEYYDHARDEEFKGIDEMNVASATRQGW
ncbi:MAG TPA: flagellar export protein FliJ [Spirochaetia bacterium]|nr:flagellar export protein FliJ [Spirochaetia bacterium]